jgi:perosamine synthetase
MNAIPRFGARIPAGTSRIIAECRARGELARGPAIAEFERRFAARLGVEGGIATSYGRMAFYRIVEAYAFPPGSEIVVPALTFWVIPELARVAGLRVVFADVDPITFTLSPAALERAITPRTRAVVPTHLYGLPCDMDAILAIAARHRLVVIEDCAHALGATYRGRPVGALGDAALFSFQTLKPLMTFRGGMAIVRDPAIRARVRAAIERDPWPTERQLEHTLQLGRLETAFMRPGVFTYTGFPILLAASLWRGRPDVYLWEKIRSLSPLPPEYTRRYTNVQAAVGLAGLDHLDAWTEATRRHARLLDAALASRGGGPYVPPGREHVYYQYSVYVPDRDAFVRGALRRGVDVEIVHMDVCPRLPLFATFSVDAPGADRAAEAVQLPAYASLADRDVERVAAVAHALLSMQERLSKSPARFRPPPPRPT